MSGVIDARKRKISILPDFATTVRIVDSDALVTGGTEGLGVRIVDIQADRLASPVVAYVIPWDKRSAGYGASSYGVAHTGHLEEISNHLQSITRPKETYRTSTPPALHSAADRQLPQAAHHGRSRRLPYRLATCGASRVAKGRRAQTVLEAGKYRHTRLGVVCRHANSLEYRCIIQVFSVVFIRKSVAVGLCDIVKGSTPPSPPMRLY